MPTPRVMIDAGHYGKYNRSPAVPEYYESDMSWSLHLKLKKELEAYGIEVGTTRKNKASDLEVYARGKKARGYDMFVSLHSNAVGSGVNEGVDRPVVIRLASDKNEGEYIAQRFADMICEVMQTKQAGQVNTRLQDNGNEYYGVLRGSKAVGCPHSFIIEHSFHTATAPSKWLLNDSNLDILAKREARIIADYFGIKEKEDEVNMTKAELEALIDKKIKENEEKVYHYWSEIPSWAAKPLKAMYDNRFFSGSSPSDLNINKTKLECLVIIARIMRDRGIIKY